MEAPIPDQPDISNIHAWGHTLCRQPAQQGMVDDPGGMADSTHLLTDSRPDQPFCRKKGHLRIIGDRTDHAGMRGKVLQAISKRSLPPTFRAAF